MVKQLSSREKFIFFICLMTIFGYLGYSLGYKPLQLKNKSLQGKISTKERQLKKNMRIIEKGAAYDNAYEKAVERFRQRQSDEKEMSYIFSEIEKVANQGGMEIVQLKPQKIKQAGSFNHFSVSIVINGSLKEIAQFLNTLQSDPFFFDVDEVRFTKLSQRSAKIKCQLIISRSLLPVSG